LVIGEEAVVVGSIAANRVVVSGRVSGAIFGDNVVLHSKAHVEGDISSCSLAIEQGATFDGRARKVTDPREVAPQLEPTPEAEIVVPFRS
jgi:cytoskeletal protein CcmA (bactofilin family)